MSACLGIDLLTRVPGLTSNADPDLTSTLLVTLIVAGGGAAVGLVLLWVRAFLARRARLADLQPTSPSLASDETPTAPGATFVAVEPWGAVHALPRRLPSGRSLTYLFGTRGASRGAGEAWLTEYMDRLRLVLPNLPAMPPIEPQATTAADTTLMMDAITLSRIMGAHAESEPVTLLLPSVAAALSADATVEMAAVHYAMDAPPSSDSVSPVFPLARARRPASR